MSYNTALIAELQMEGANTRKMLALVPMDKTDYKPHEKSMLMPRLANHIAELPSWIGFTMQSHELDLSTMDYKPVIPATAEELVAKHDEMMRKAIAVLEAATNDEDFDQMWTLRMGDHVIFSMPKKVVLRSMVFSHIVHHRGQLSVYLRLLDIAIPGMYGPSADDAR